ncbi:hypothetical protein OG949_04990 [Streptomyces scopuliridis]|uniref:hypothetical protein n=1 Tax=Streptomyces scopuliridis TaxID=452529 RepID=UPI002DD8CF98|nr:hypothetical protein [Streptomyces scopuliridis]WSB32278.1 hypothetical protein OG949_04990 [Streptomyces scopuliridis]
MNNIGRDRLCAERVRDLEEWRRGMEADVVHLAEVAEIQPPQELLEEPRIGLATLDSLFEHEDIEAINHEDATWITSHLLAYVAIYLIKKFEGRWAVDTDRESPTYARYLVELPAPYGGESVRIDVAQEVHTFLHEPMGRSLLQLVIRLEGKVAP